MVRRCWLPSGTKSARLQREGNDHSAFEGPDPLWWVPKGYAIVNVDSRGVWHSQGKATFWNHEEGDDGYDLIEFLGGQEWGNGKGGGVQLQIRPPDDSHLLVPVVPPRR